MQYKMESVVFFEIYVNMNEKEVTTMFDGKMKAVTFSMDDGVHQDIRLIELLNKYNLKATFNLNSERLGVESYCVKKEDVKYIYEGHEVAGHTLTHPYLPHIEDDKEVIRQVEEDRVNLSELVGYEVVGMAYPGGYENTDDRVVKLIRENTGIQYARVWKNTQSFELQTDLLRFRGTTDICNDPRLMELTEAFLASKAEIPQIFYVSGHAYHLDQAPGRWEALEEFFKVISGHPDVFYGTNREVLLRK